MATAKRSVKTRASKKVATKKVAARKVARGAKVTAEGGAGQYPSHGIGDEVDSQRRGAPRGRRLDLRVDDDTFAAVHELAERKQRPGSDVVRDALRRYVDAS